MNRTVLLLVVTVLCFPQTCSAFQAGAAIVDITPVQFPVLVNGGMFSQTAEHVISPLHARALVMEDDDDRVAVVVVDSCMMPRSFLDEARQMISTRTGLRVDRILISATHTHSAPSVMACLGTEADPNYVPFLREKLLQSVMQAMSHREPARVGWSTVRADDFTALRRWIRRPDRITDDPFGNPTVRANMHAATHWDDVTGPSGPEDPWLSLMVIQSTQGRPLALLANFSMHYFSDAPISADYFGLFCDILQQQIGTPDTVAATRLEHPFVAILSHGCSGDIWRRDYAQPVATRHEPTLRDYTERLAAIAMEGYYTVDYQECPQVTMAESHIQLKYRVPDKQRLEWAQRIVLGLEGREPRDTTEVYAREQVILHELQSTEIVVQALRIGDIAIATTPTETYALTGLKIKLQSPLAHTMVVELANGGDGYIPPPEQHRLGGYNTWPARSAGLEVQAEPKIVEASLQLLEQVTGLPRREYRQSRGVACEAMLRMKPRAVWRLDEFSGPRAVDSSTHHADAMYEPGVVYFLDGPAPTDFCRDDEPNRAAHFAGGRLRAWLDDLPPEYSVSLWFWNGMPVDARPMAGWMFSRGRDGGALSTGDHIGLGGTDHPGRLVWLTSDSSSLRTFAGKTEIPRWSWNHLIMVRQKEQADLYLNGQTSPEVTVKGPSLSSENAARQLFIGGRCDGDSNWEGRIDEVAIFDRALTSREIEEL